MGAAAEVSVAGSGIFLLGLNVVWEEKGCKAGGLMGGFYCGITADTCYLWGGVGR